MNATSLNKLLSYLQGLSLTASNQRWLADLGFFCVIGIACKGA